MGRYFNSLLIVFILSGTTIFAQDQSRKGRGSNRNVDQFKVNAYPVVTEGDNIRLLVYGLIPYQSLQFIKDEGGFSAGYEASLGIRDKDGQISALTQSENDIRFRIPFGWKSQMGEGMGIEANPPSLLFSYHCYLYHPIETSFLPRLR